MQHTFPILLYLSVKFDYIPYIGFLFMAGKRFVSDKHLTLDCDLDLSSWNLHFVHDIPSHFALSFYEV